jgi:hypothetical protein
MLKLLIVIFLLSLPIIDAKRCNSCCSCSENKFKRELAKTKQENDIIKSKTINLGNNFALSVSDVSGEHIGFIHDVYDPTMSIPPNSQINIEPRIHNTENTPEFARIFYDFDHKGLFTDLPIPGNYTAKQISLPAKSVSSIIIPRGYQATLYANDDFNGNFIVLTSSQKDFGRFNDQMVSIEITKIFEKQKEHVAVINSQQNSCGKQIELKKTGLKIGESYRIKSSQIGSIIMDPGYEVYIYDNAILIDIYSSSMNIISTHMPFIVTVNVQKIGNLPTEYAVFYDDVDYKGPHFILLSPPIIYNMTIGKVSSLQIPADYEVVLHEQQNMQGAHIVLTGNIPNMNLYLFNDRAMTIIYRRKESEQIQNAIIFMSPNFIGETITLPIGYSEISDPIYAGSIKVPPGLKVTLEKQPMHPLNYERKYTYISDSSNTQNFFDTPLMSVLVEIY